MPDYLVRISRAYWHSGDVTVKDVPTEHDALGVALHHADDVELKDWGDLVTLPQNVIIELLVEQSQLPGQEPVILQEALIMGAQGAAMEEPPELTIEAAAQHAAEAARETEDPQCAADHIQLSTWLHALERARNLVGEQKDEQIADMVPETAAEAALIQALQRLQSLIMGLDPDVAVLESYRAQLKAAETLTEALRKEREDAPEEGQ